MKDEDYKFFINHSDEKVQQISLLKRKVGKTFLDIGPGEGIITISLKPMFNRVEVVEEKEKYCEKLKKKGIITHNTKFEDFETNIRYDVILASHIMTYLDDKEEAIDKMFNLLKVGGQLLIFNMNYMGLMEVIKDKIHPNIKNRSDFIIQNIVKKYPVYEREVIPINITTSTADGMLRAIRFLSEKRPKLWEKHKDGIKDIIDKTSVNNGYKLGYYNILYTIYKV